MKRVEEREAVTFENKGEKIFGVLHCPLNATKAPAILFCSGLGGSKCGKRDFFVYFARLLAEQGFVVLRFDYRATGDSEGDPEAVTLEDKVSDTVEALKFLSSHPKVDVNRVGILGRSLGGAVAVMAFKFFSKIKSFALWAPVYSGKQWLELMKLAKQPHVSDEVQSQLKDCAKESPNDKFLEQFLKLDLKDDLQIFQKIPLLHIHGDLDSVVKPIHAESFYRLCKDFKTAKFIRLPQTEHDFVSSPERGIAVKETSEWFKATLM